jgi:hypothetical protein
MNREIIVGRNKYIIEYSPKVAMEILHKIIEWMEENNHYASSHGEGIMQDDNCQIDAPVLIADIVDNILKPQFIEEI